MKCLKTVLRVSLCCPKLVPVSVLSTLFLMVVFLVISLTCGVNVTCGSYLTPSMVGVLLRGRGELKRVTCGWVLDYRRSGVNRVREDLFADAVILLAVSHCSNCVVYCCRSLVAVCRFGLCEVIVMSSAYRLICTFCVRGWGMSWVKRLKSAGDKIAPFNLRFCLSENLPAISCHC